MTMMLAVVPDVLGRPVIVFGHSAVGRGEHNSQMMGVAVVCLVILISFSNYSVCTG